LPEFVLLDRSRQWPTNYGQMSDHHFERYRYATFAAHGRILDAACGCGYGTQMLSEGAREVVGVDISAEAIRWANKFFPGPKYIQGMIEEAPWEGQFDTIVSLETVEHIPDPKPSLKVFRKSCRGELIVSVPNEELYPFKAENFLGDESPHFRHYTPDQFQELLEGCGFRVVERACQSSKTDPYVRSGTDGKFLIYVCA
jgi:2-polyprenyl-3-methyl-5-hydroxy-6-metoxy-1,4-benzoquinol methylase